MRPSTVRTCYWPGEVSERAKGQTQVLEAEPRITSKLHGCANFEPMVVFYDGASATRSSNTAIENNDNYANDASDDGNGHDNT